MNWGGVGEGGEGEEGGGQLLRDGSGREALPPTDSYVRGRVVADWRGVGLGEGGGGGLRCTRVAWVEEGKGGC